MPRRAQIKHGGRPHSIIQRGNDRSAGFFSEGKYRFFLERVLGMEPGFRIVHGAS